MRHRRVKWLLMAGIGLLLLGYGVGRQHQRDTVAAYRALAIVLHEMVAAYETANTILWTSIGQVARPDP